MMALIKFQIQGDFRISSRWNYFGFGNSMKSKKLDRKLCFGYYHQLVQQILKN